MRFNVKVPLIILFSVFIFSIPAFASDHEKSSIPDKDAVESLQGAGGEEGLHSVESQHAEESGHGHVNLGEMLPLMSWDTGVQNI